MIDYSIKNILAVGIGIIIVINLIAIVVGIVNMNSLSNDIQSKLDNTNDLLTKLNSNIQGLDQLNNKNGLIIYYSPYPRPEGRGIYGLAF